MLDLASGVLDQWTAGRAARDRQMKALTFPLDILGNRSMQIAWTSLMFYVLLCMRSGPHSLGSHIVHTADICVEAEEQRRALRPDRRLGIDGGLWRPRMAAAGRR